MICEGFVCIECVKENLVIQINLFREVIKMTQATFGSKIVFVDGVDWQHEIGEIDTIVWPSLKSILSHVPCAAESCGVMRCEIIGLEWVHPQNLHKEESVTSIEDRILLQEKHIASYQRRIEQIQKLVARIRSEKTEQREGKNVSTKQTNI